MNNNAIGAADTGMSGGDAPSGLDWISATPGDSISIILPLLNEEAVITELLERCLDALRTFPGVAEVICVDDGSSDGSPAVLLSFHRRDPRIKILTLSRTFGHQAAFTAGLSVAKGDIVVMMDGDLQDPPELLPRMFSILREQGCDVVSGRRNHRQDKLSKRLSVKLFHNVFNRLSRVRINDDIGNFSMFTRKVLDAINQLHERERYLPGLRMYVGFRHSYIDYDRGPRGRGESKMSTSMLTKLAFDAIFSFSDVPIKICLYLGVAGFLASCAAIFYTLLSKFTGIAPLGWSSLIISIYLWGSIQLLFLGILGEYLFRIYRETQKRPLYFIQEYLQ